MSNHTATVQNKDQYKNQLITYMKSVENHPVFDNQYFQYLKRNKLTPEIYKIHRANFFYRTMATVMGIAHICAGASSHHDQDTLILFSYILNEECGNGDKAQCHELLMEQSHNIFGQQEFGVEPLEVKKSENELIIQEAKDYRSKINFLLNKSYPTMLGVAFALETHASVMLTNFRDAFINNRKKMNDKEYKKQVEIYFNCHLDSGVEDRHASDAQQCIINNCTSEAALAEIIYGINETLKIQHHLWCGMYDKVSKLNNQNNISKTHH